MPQTPLLSLERGALQTATVGGKRPHPPQAEALWWGCVPGGATCVTRTRRPFIIWPFNVRSASSSFEAAVKCTCAKLGDVRLTTSGMTRTLETGYPWFSIHVLRK